jgi:uncharacterized protein YoxC
MDIAAVTGVGIGAALGGVAVLLTAAAGAYVQVRSNKTIQSTARDVEEVKATTHEIDRAVNGKIKGAQTIGEQVDDLHGEIPVRHLETVDDNDAILPLVRAMASTIEAIEARLSKDQT